MTGEGPAEAPDGVAVVIDVPTSPSGTEFRETTRLPGSDPHIAETLSAERPAHQR
ncbi:hypothetical protein ACWD7F_07325 [Streptomyces sp. NPDC005122]